MAFQNFSTQILIAQWKSPTALTYVSIIDKIVQSIVIVFTIFSAYLHTQLDFYIVKFQSGLGTPANVNEFSQELSVA